MSTHPKPQPKSADKVRHIPAGEFKAKCLHLMNDISEDGPDVIVTKRGKPVVRVTAYREPQQRPFRSVVGRCGPIQVKGNILSPLPEEDTIPIDPFVG